MLRLANTAEARLTRRAVVQGAAVAALAMVARPVLAQQVPMQTHLPPGVEPKPKGPRVFLDYDQEELDLAYNQVPWAPNQQDVARRSAQKDAAAAAFGPPRRLTYGPTGIEELDLYTTDRPNAPIIAFIHGGAWRGAVPPEDGLAERAFMAASAEMFVDRGAHFAYAHFTNVLATGGDLMPMADQVRRAVAWIYGNAASFGGDPNRVFVAGHSSGGHLAGVVLTTDWPRDFGLPIDIVKGGLCISGIYDLYPVSLSARRSYVDFSPRVVEELSSLRHLDRLVSPVIVTHGTLETPEFQRQNRDFSSAVRAAGKPVQFLVGEGYNHFEILETFSDPYGLLGRAALEQMGLEIA